MSNQDLFSKLKCIRCGVKDFEIAQYKSHGVIPTCTKCRRKFQIQSYSKILLFFLIVAFIIVTVALLIFLPGLSRPKEEYGPYSTSLEWILRLAPFSIGLFIVIIVLIILRMKFGSKLDKYFKYDKDGKIKSETDIDWKSYRDWIKMSLLERDFPNDEISKSIESEVNRQLVFKNKSTKLGKIWSRIGYLNIFLSILSLIYGLIVSQGAGRYWIVPFSTVHLPSSLVLLIFGILFLIYGKQKKKFYNLQ